MSSAPSPDEIDAIRAARKALHEEYGRRAWFRGVGIAPSSTGLVLRLNVDSESDVAPDELPRRYRGFEVEVVRISAYRPRDA